MILSNPKAPLLFGTVMIGFLAVYLTLEHPTPGPLAAPHAQAVNGAALATCRACHAENGLAQGCLHCHAEIRGQIEADHGYHAFLLRGRELSCAECHPDHAGPEFRLVSQLSWGGQDPNRFDHAHVRFTLAGAHEDLDCEACHRRPVPWTLPDFPGQPRQHTYLGLTQECADCHEDVHEGTLARSCQVCHGQEAFRPAAQFNHSDYYVLEGPHARAACSACHRIDNTVGGVNTPPADVNGMRLAFGKARGKTCTSCHETPHRTRWSGECTTCHLGADEMWGAGVRGVDARVHALTGFPLDEAHAAVACGACHPAGRPYDRRYPDPNAPTYDRRPQMCQSCHEDPHGGQFQGRYAGCAECHAGANFKPARFDAARHARTYPLSTPHAKVVCLKCHPVDSKTGVQRFVAIPRGCEACHADPHAGQFRERHAQCTDCHEQERFVPARYGMAQHTALYALTGAHAAAPCIRCHVMVPVASGGTAAGDTASGGVVRRFASTPRMCRECHSDPHAGQFEREMAQGDCTVCHRQDASTFNIRPYDHARQTGYPLTGAHATARCEDCHRQQRGGEGTGPFLWTRVYKKTPVACDACHVDVHRGQFRREGTQDCRRCHGSTAAWTSDRFDHNRDARFKLEGAHADLACSACHPAARQPDGQDVVQYRPLGTRCEDCHGFTPK